MRFETDTETDNEKPKRMLELENGNSDGGNESRVV